MNKNNLSIDQDRTCRGFKLALICTRWPLWEVTVSCMLFKKKISFMVDRQIARPRWPATATASMAARKKPCRGLSAPASPSTTSRTTSSQPRCPTSTASTTSGRRRYQTTFHSTRSRTLSSRRQCRTTPDHRRRARAPPPAFSMTFRRNRDLARRIKFDRTD
jgi:hypothetical protein